MYGERPAAGIGWVEEVEEVEQLEGDQDEVEVLDADPADDGAPDAST